MRFATLLITFVGAAMAAPVGGPEAVPDAFSGDIVTPELVVSGFALSNEEAASMDLPDSQPFPLDPHNQKIYMMKAHHLLHCVVRNRYRERLQRAIDQDLFSSWMGETASTCGDAASISYLISGYN